MHAGYSSVVSELNVYAFTCFGVFSGIKGEVYHANLLSFQNPKTFVCQQKQRNNCQVCYKLLPQWNIVSAVQ